MNETSTLVDSATYKAWLDRPETQWYLSKLEYRVRTLEFGFSHGTLGLDHDTGKIDPDALVQHSIAASALNEIIENTQDYDWLLSLEGAEA